MAGLYPHSDWKEEEAPSSASSHLQIASLSLDTSSQLVLKNVSAGNHNCGVCSDNRRSDCAPSALGHIFQASLSDLEAATQRKCPLCTVLYNGARHFSRMFEIMVRNLAEVNLQYSENLAAAAYRRNDMPRSYCEILISFSGQNLAPIQLLLTPAGMYSALELLRKTGT